MALSITKEDLQNTGTSASIEVLLVEDDPINQIVTSEILKRLGFSVTIANHGREALELITDKKYRVVLMDIQMPEMDGCEATLQIRSMVDSYYKKVPIIAYTASSLADTKEKAKELGMDDFVSKPLNPQEMEDKITLYARRAPSPKA